MKAFICIVSCSTLLCGVALSQPGPSGRLPGSDRQRVSDLFNSPPLAQSDFERQVLAVLADVGTNERRGSMSVPEADGRLLRLLAEVMDAKQVVEIGTSVGYSGLWFCLALHETGGKLTTYEIDPGRAARARENFRRAGVESLVTLVEGDAHQEVRNFTGTIDLLFIDADKEGYQDYLRQLLPRLRPGALVVAHNMNRQQADPDFVKAITTDPALETLFIKMESSGIGLTLKKH